MSKLYPKPKKKFSKIILLIFLIFVFFFEKNFIKYFILDHLKKFSNKKRIGVISLPVDQNIGNILVKFAMFKKLEEFGLNATIISPNHKLENLNPNISFLKKTINSHLLSVNDNFSELKERDFDYLMVNSDQTWNFYGHKFFYNVALLKFAENWKVNKFIYAASTGNYNWYFKKISKFNEFITITNKIFNN